MRFKFDENMPEGLIADIIAIGHDVETCAHEGIAGAGDPAIAAHSQQESRIIVTLDLDFADIRVYPPGTHPGIVVLRSKSPDVYFVQSALARLFATVKEADFLGSLIVVDQSRIRIRRPPSTP
jgi:predicted nuclease of predicted toxin-antitoxin system